jgi:hypothetical protein
VIRNEPGCKVGDIVFMLNGQYLYLVTSTTPIGIFRVTARHKTRRPVPNEFEPVYREEWTYDLEPVHLDVVQDTNTTYRESKQGVPDHQVRRVTLVEACRLFNQCRDFVHEVKRMHEDG